MAHKKGEGSTSNGRDSASKRLGVKLFGGQGALAGNIIIRQRGTRYHAGENVYLGKDYTIHAAVDGTVTFRKGRRDRTIVSIMPFVEVAETVAKLKLVAIKPAPAPKAEKPIEEVKAAPVAIVAPEAPAKKEAPVKKAVAAPKAEKPIEEIKAAPAAKAAPKVAAKKEAPVKKAEAVPKAEKPIEKVKAAPKAAAKKEAPVKKVEAVPKAEKPIEKVKTAPAAKAAPKAAAKKEAPVKKAEAAPKAEKPIEKVKAAPKEKPAAKAPAKKAEATAAPKKAAKSTGKDDFKKIEGVGPKIASLINDAGITTFAQLAAANADKLNEILEAAGSRYKMHDPTTWPQQAALAAEGKWDELAELQANLKGGRVE